MPPWLWCTLPYAVLVLWQANGYLDGSPYARAVARRRGWRTIRECWRGLSRMGARFAWLLPDGSWRWVRSAA